MKHSIQPSWKPHGKALEAYWNGNKDAAIGISTEDGDINYMPVDIYFRTENELPEIESFALSLCRGEVLDVGAGAGAHSMILQNNGHEVTAIDVSSEAVEIMNHLGIKNTICSDFLLFQPHKKYDTLLFLMNGIGITSNLDGLRKYLLHAHQLSTHEGQLILDSSDLRVQHQTNENTEKYFGEISYQLSFESHVGAPYQWLYVDTETLNEIATECGWQCQVIYEEEDGSYLARLTKISN